GTNGNTQGEKKLNSPCIKTVKAEIPVSIENPICFSPFFLLFIFSFRLSFVLASLCTFSFLFK
uniref:hypothetical protein n=1 Tax=[Ruminococcus] torques TaxID=33039 RepID=UPI00402A7226